MKNEFWQTPRGKAIIKLGLWGIFFLVLFILIGLEKPINNEINNNEETEVKQFVLYYDMLEEIKQNNYKYKYSIKINDLNYILEGSKNGLIEEGLLESNNNIFKYYIDSNGIYKVNLDQKEKIDKLDNNIDDNIININNLLEMIKDIDYKVEKEDEIRNIIYDSSDFSLVVTTDLNHIKNINYKKGIDEYNLEIYSIGEVK